MHRLSIRVLVVLTVLAGTIYLGWRWGFSVAWDNWWIAVPLVLAETFFLIDAYLFGLAMWRIKQRGPAPAPPSGATVDVFITSYNEPVWMVSATARAAVKIRYPHRTWILDDGERPQLRQAAQSLGVGYLTRDSDWADRPRHAKAGNLNNALFFTEGEYMLILDADQIPHPSILDKTLGWFTDPQVGMVQTPQWFVNVTESDPLGSQAPLFYGPIQQGKDGWNAAFFCGSNTVLRREALMQLGVVGYVREVESAVRQALRLGSRMLTRTATEAKDQGPEVVAALTSVRRAAHDAMRQLDAGHPVGDVTYAFQQQVDAASRQIVDRDVVAMRADLAELAALAVGTDEEMGGVIIDDVAIGHLAQRDLSPLGALESVRALVRAIDVDRTEEAQPMMPLATMSVTEDLATSMSMHAMGWKSVYHHEILAHGVAPEDLGTMLQQRLRWAQGALQVLLRENPLTNRGLSVGQRLMYFATMWSYLAGFAALALFAAPVVFLCTGILPVRSFDLMFLLAFVPYFLLTQALFCYVGYGVTSWRGHQYGLALFPIWIRACVNGVANVYFHRPLGFAATPKTRQPGGGIPWRLIWPQVTVSVVLVMAVVIGLTRLYTGQADDALATWVNVLWVTYDLLVLSVIYRAALFQAPETTKELTR